MDQTHWNGSTIRRLELGTIREFLERHRDEFREAVLDFGCGDQRYAGIVRSTGAEYHPFDRARFRDANVAVDVGADELLAKKWPVVMSTQVITVVDDPMEYLTSIRNMLVPEGRLILTYNTNWDEVGDLWRFTKIGMELLLDRAGFELVLHERRGVVVLGDFEFPLGYGLVARPRAADASVP